MNITPGRGVAEQRIDDGQGAEGEWWKGRKVEGGR